MTGNSVRASRRVTVEDFNRFLRFHGLPPADAVDRTLLTRLVLRPERVVIVEPKRRA